MAAAQPTPAQLAESLLAFWADAGVDALLLDEAVDRIAAGQIAPPPRALPPAAAPRGRIEPARADSSAATATAHKAAAEAGDLQALVAAIAAFEGCPLRYDGAASQAVVWRGDPNAPLMIIGEGPGADEDAQGAPFVGKAGKMLDRMLAAAGLEGRAFVTNTVFWRPPGNRTPTAAEQAVCAPFLERMIALIQPRLLLLVGGASAKSLLRTEEGIMKLRGRWAEWTSSDGDLTRPALPTLHPAFLLRQPAAKRDAWRDMMTLAERLDRPDAPL